MTLALARRFVAVLGLLAVIGQNSLCAQEARGESAGGTAASARPIKIGCIDSISGSSAVLGKEMINGMNLYLEQCHHQMGGHPVEAIIEDDGGNPATAIGKLHKLLDEDKVDIVNGFLLAHVLYASAPIVNEHKIPLVVSVSGADDVTQRKRMKWVIRTSWTSSLPTHPFGEYVAKKLRYKKVVTLVSDYSYGWELVGGFQRTFEANGGQIIQKLWTPLGFTDFSDVLKQVRPDADAIFVCHVGQSAKIVPKQIAEAGLKIPIIGATVSFEETILSSVGQDLVGAISTDPYSAALDTPANKAFVAAFREKYHSEPTWISECAYTNAMWINKAIDALHGDVSDKEKLLAALKKVEMTNQAPRGPMKLDPYGMVMENIYIRKVQKVGGKYQNVVIDTYPMVSQFWKWNPEQYMKEPPYSKDYPPCTHCK